MKAFHEHDRADAREAVARMIKWIGDDPGRAGVLETPGRVVRSWEELFAGYLEDPREHLKKRFPIDNSQMVSLNRIEFFSTCEHHMLPFLGEADVAYIPSKEVCGLSKLARVVHGYARRLQMQETLTDQIATAIHTELQPIGVAVRLRGRHLCMAARGVRANAEAVMVTTSLRGRLLNEPTVKAEWLASLP